MDNARRVLGATAVIANLAAAGYWVWGFVHVWLASRPEFDPGRGLLYTSWVLPGILAAVALVWVRHFAIRTLAVVANVLAAIWWVAYTAAMPERRWFQLFPSLFVFAAIVAVAAIMVDPRQSPSAPSRVP